MDTIKKTPITKLNKGDCINVMDDISDNSVDLILCDLPYGITSCKWDSIIPFDCLWSHYKRIITQTGVIALHASQPFTSALVMSNPDMFRHEWIWIKNRGSNFANTVREPMKEHESILIFSYGKWTYNKQMQERTGGGLDRAKYLVNFNDQNREAYKKFKPKKSNKITKLRVPSSWQKFNVEVGLHPTQKPIKLLEYLIKTYTDEDNWVLDNCMGSGSTGIACLNTKRNFIGIEKEKKYFDIAQSRINEHRTILLEKNNV